MSNLLDDVARLAAALAHRLPGPSRRELLELAACSIALAGCRDQRARPPGRPADDAGAPAPAPALDGPVYRTLDAATARILPSTGDFPGAREAGVMTFLDRQLAIPPLTRLAPAFVALARLLDQQATARGRRDFAGLDPAAQDEVLEQLARGALTGVTLPQRELFRALHTMTLEGLLADPRHGGNRDQVGWRAIGFPTPSLRAPGGPAHHGH